VAVRGAAEMLNDATLADARLAGLNEIADVIGKLGRTRPGRCARVQRRVPASCSRAPTHYRQRQGNFETLAGTSRQHLFSPDDQMPRGRRAHRRNGWAHRR
jgi:uncharacterized protein with ATP-grasp and redox domains